MRNIQDLSSLACPDKYKTIGNFYEYYTGIKKAPIPTLFIGGNHEASNYLWELYYGGFVAENIYFLGLAGVIRFGGLRIGGISGIYKPQHYHMGKAFCIFFYKKNSVKVGFFERYPFNGNACRTVYHTRKLNVFRLLQVCLFNFFIFF
jgi:lariat debranching enzyme